MSKQGSAGNVIAAICCFFLPGLGQLVQGRIMAAAFFFIATSLLYASAFLTLGLTWLLGMVTHFWCIVNAARYRSNT